MPIKLSFPDDGRKRDQAFIEFAERAFTAAGITQQQAESIAAAWQTHVDTWLEADTAREEAAVTHALGELKKEWGGQLDANLAAGRKAAGALGLDPAALDGLDRTIGSPAVMSLLARLGSKVSIDPGTGKASITIADPAAARAEIAKLSGDRQFQDAMRDLKNPTARAEALAKWEDLHAAAYPAADAAPPAPAPTPAPAAPSGTPTRRDAALARIEALRGDQAFQDRMRNPGPGRESAVAEWNDLHQRAYTDEGV